MVGRAGVFLVFAADEGAVFDPRHVARVAAGEVAVRAQLGVELLEGAGSHELGTEPVVFGLAAVAPVNVPGFGEGRHFGDPFDQAGVVHVQRHAQAQPFQQGTVHGNSNL